MNKRLEALAIRRHLLMKTIASQRLELAEISLRWKTPLAVVDTSINAAKFMHNHPALVSGSLAAILAWRKNGVAGMALQGWRALYLYPSFLPMVLKYLHLPARTQNNTDADD